MNTNVKGAITELKCKTYFLELGYIVSTPEFPARYDFILDIDKKLLKIQVKTCRISDGKLTFSTCSSHFINGKVTHTEYTSDGVDFFCTEHERECYLIPVTECGKTEKSLRLFAPANNQSKNICFAQDYVASKVINEMLGKA